MRLSTAIDSPWNSLRHPNDQPASRFLVCAHICRCFRLSPIEYSRNRAAARLAADPGYQGETWNVPAEQLAGSDAAVVNIEVQPAGEQPDLRLVSVRADYPDHPRHRARQTKRALVQLPTRKGANP